MKRIAWIGLAGVPLAVGVVVWLVMSDVPGRDVSREGAASSSKGMMDSSHQGKEGPSASRRGKVSVSKRKETAASDEDAVPLSEEEKAAAAEEAKIDAFDNLTDRWMDPAEKGVTMKDVDGFVDAFRQIPKGRQDECIHRALNLIPDENVMLLAGVLMDKTADKEIVEAVFNDVLNRDEDVKKPILQQIFKDKTHPCWKDTAWILDVTGELPKATSKK